MVDEVKPTKKRTPKAKAPAPEVGTATVTIPEAPQEVIRRVLHPVETSELLEEIKLICEEVVQRALETTLQPALEQIQDAKAVHERAIKGRDAMLEKLLVEGHRLRQSAGSSFCEIVDRGGYTIGSGESPMQALRNAFAPQDGH